MKTKFFSSFLAVGFAFVALNACKKDSTTTSSQDEVNLQTTTSANANDQVRLQTDDDDFDSDATTAVGAAPAFSDSTKLTDASIIPGAIVDRSAYKSKKIKIKYLGTSTTGVTRNGTITIELVSGATWANAGAILKQTFDTCTVSRGGKTFTYNGVRYVTNVTGGLVGLRDTVIHSIRANATIMFDNGSTRSWWAARRNTYLYKTSPKVFMSNGDSTVNGELCSMGGLTRGGVAFLVKSPQAIVASSQFNWQPTAGIRIITTASDKRSVTLTYGVSEALGWAQVTSGRADGIKVEWKRLSGDNGQFIIRY